MSHDSRQPQGHPSPLDRVLLANGARARLLERDPDNGALRERSSHVHTASRLAGRNLARDRGGQAMKSGARTQFGPRTDAHEHELARFAGELAGQLEPDARDAPAQRLFILASQPFLGMLLDALGPHARGRLAAHVALDLVREEGAELERRVTAALARST